MITASLVATSPRRAALLVHALARPDQEWLLASLAPHHRVELEGLLEELATLGIPPDEGVLRQVLEAPPQDQSAGAIDRLERLAPAQVESLAQLLREEPPRVAASLLAAHAWPWKEAVLQALPAACAEVRPPAPALQQATCESVLRHLAARPPVVRTPSGGWKRWWPVRRGEQRA